MVNAVFNRGEWGDLSIAITASSEDANFPVANLLKPQGGIFWKTLVDSGVFFRVNIGTGQSVDMVSLLYTNFTSAATWRVRLGDSQAEVDGGAADIDSGTITAWAQTDMSKWDFAHSIFRAGSASTNSWLRVDLNDAANPDGFLTVGRLMAGASYEPTINFQYGGGIGYVSQPLRDRSIANVLYVEERQAFQTASLTFDHIPEDEFWPNMQTIFRLHGNHKPIQLVMDIGDNANRADKAIYGVIERIGTSQLTSVRRVRTQIQIAEML